MSFIKTRFKGITLDIYYNLEKGEEQTYHYPGSPDKIEIEEIYYSDHEDNKSEVSLIFEELNLIDDIEKHILTVM